MPAKKAAKKKKRTVVYVIPHVGGWAARCDGRIIHRFPKELDQTKDDAIAWAVEYAKKREPSQVKIHKQDGTFQKEYTYGDDPEKSKG